MDLLSHPPIFSHDPVRLFTTVPPGTRVLEVRAGTDTVIVDLDEHARDFKRVEAAYHGWPVRGELQWAFLAQMVFTATGQQKDAAVQILVRGQRVKHLGTGETDFSLPWRRSQFEMMVFEGFMR